jgi:hypothetical protein
MHTPSLAAFVPQLMAAVHRDDDDIQDVAFLLMGRLPQNALAPHAPALVRWLGTTSSHHLIPLLAKLDLCTDPEVTAALCGALQSADYAARFNALRALGEQPSGPLAVYVPNCSKFS